jgi:hypothetical protein
MQAKARQRQSVRRVFLRVLLLIEFARSPVQRDNVLVSQSFGVVKRGRLYYNNHKIKQTFDTTSLAGVQKGDGGFLKRIEFSALND